MSGEANRSKRLRSGSGFAQNIFHQILWVLSGIAANMIWRNRNSISHPGKGLDVYQTSGFVRCRSNYFFSHIFKFCVLDGNTSTVWQIPEGNVIKINCDGSWLNLINIAGLECVMRDSSAKNLGSLAMYQDTIISSVDAEGLALLKAMQWAPDLDLQECSFETDCQEAFKLIQEFGPC